MLPHIVCEQSLTHCCADCPEDVDSVWNILWPFTPPGDTVSISCGVDFLGTYIYVNAVLCMAKVWNTNMCIHLTVC